MDFRSLGLNPGGRVLTPNGGNTPSQHLTSPHDPSLPIGNPPGHHSDIHRRMPNLQQSQHITSSQAYDENAAYDPNQYPATPAARDQRATVNYTPGIYPQQRQYREPIHPGLESPNLLASTGPSSSAAARSHSPSPSPYGQESWQLPPENSSPPAASELVPAELQHRIATDFRLSSMSLVHLRDFVTLLGRMSTMSKDQAILEFYRVALNLRTHDLLEQQNTRLPSISMMSNVVEKIDTRLSDGAFKMSSVQLETIRDLAREMIIDSERFTFVSFNAEVFERLENNPKKFGLEEGFKDISSRKSVKKDAGAVCSSISGGYKEDIVRSVDPGAKGELQSLILFGLRMCKKYLGSQGSHSKLTRTLLIKLAILRRFPREHPAVLPIVDDGKGKERGLRGPKRRRVLEDHPHVIALPPLGIIQGPDDGTMYDWNGEVVDEPPLPSTNTYWSLFEWHFERLKTALGPEPTTPLWAEYVSKLIAEDLEMFPLETDKGSTLKQVHDTCFGTVSPSAPSTSPQEQAAAERLARPSPYEAVNLS